MTRFTPTAVERAMRIQEVILRAQRGEIKWKQAAKIVGMSPRSLRRWRSRNLTQGKLGLIDQRKNRPSPKAASMEELLRGKALKDNDKSVLTVRAAQWHKHIGIRAIVTNALESVRGIIIETCSDFLFLNRYPSTEAASYTELMARFFRCQTIYNHYPQEDNQ